MVLVNHGGPVQVIALRFPTWGKMQSFYAGNWSYKEITELWWGSLGTDKKRPGSLKVSFANCQGTGPWPDSMV